MIKIVLVTIGVLMSGQTEVIQRIDESSMSDCSRHVRQREYTYFTPSEYVVVGHFCVKELEV